MRALTRVSAVVLAVGLSAGHAQAGCPRADALGVARTVEIDTTGGPGFGLEHYKTHDFLAQKEVVLTFDDGPQKFSTEMVLTALAGECAKATFFSIGKMALGYPEILRKVAADGHTIGTHTWSHKTIRKLKTIDEAKDEIERGVSAVHRALGTPAAPFFRYPTLQDTPESLAHLGTRNIAMFSTDIDSFDFKPQTPENIVKTVMTKLDKSGKGIILMHDIHKTTAKAVPLLLTALKQGGYKLVHLTAKDKGTTLADYDALIDKDAKGLPVAGTERPTSSIVRTVGEAAPAAAPGSPAVPAASTTPGKAAATAPAAPAAAPAAQLQPTAAVAPAPVAARAPVTAAPAVDPVKTTAVAPQATSPVTTSSIQPASAAAATPAEGAPAVSAGTAAAAVPAKSLSERAKDIFELWFGK